METSLKTGFAQKIWVAQNLGGGLQPLSPPPARTPMVVNVSWFTGYSRRGFFPLRMILPKFSIKFYTLQNVTENFIYSVLLVRCCYGDVEKIKLERKKYYWFFFFFSSKEKERLLAVYTLPRREIFCSVFTSMRKDKMQLYSIILVLGKYFALVTFILSLKISGSRLFW